MLTNRTYRSGSDEKSGIINTSMWKYFVVLALMLFTAEAFSQAPATDTSFETRKKLSYELYRKRADRSRLQRILAALNIVDSAYIVHFPTWVINDDDVRERVIKVFRNRLKFPSRDSSLIVITNPSKTEIEQLKMGSVSMGREEVRLFLGENLRKTILVDNYSRDDAPKLIEPKKPIIEKTGPKSVFFEGSLFGGSMKFSNGWGAEIKLGNDAIGYPFWSTGSAEVALIIEQLKIGAIIPLNIGFNESEIAGPLSIQPRKLNGADGFSAGYSLNIFSGSLNMLVISSNLTDKNSNYQFTSLSNAYYVRSVGQGIYSRKLGSINNEHFFTLGIGMGYHQIGSAQIVPNVDVATTDKFDSYSPIMKVSYLRQGLHTYGVELQSYSSLLLVNSWIELVKDFVYVDLKYSLPIFRGPNAWENSYFIMLSPRIRLSF